MRARGRGSGGKPRRELGRLDTVCLLVAAVVVPDTLGAVAQGGAQTITWLGIVAVSFFVPAGLAVAELGAAFPQQGGAYVWARLAFGLAGSLVATAYRVETQVWMGGSLAITAVAVIDGLIVPLHGGRRVLVALGFVWTCVALAVVPLRAGKRVPLAGAVVQVGLLGFFTASIARAGMLTCALYAVPVLAIVLVVPAEQITGLTGFIDALAGVFVVYGRWSGLVGAVAAAAFVWVLLSNGLTWIMGCSRTQAAACLDGAGPAWLGRVSARTGTPLRATVVGGAIATATAGAAFAVAGHDNAKYFSVVLALSISLLALANLLVFPALVRLRRIRPEPPRPFRVPGGTAGAWAASGLATGWSALALAAAMWPGLGIAGAELPDGFAGDRLGFVLAELVPLVAVIAVAAVLARQGRHRRGPAVTAVAEMELEAA